MRWGKICLIINFITVIASLSGLGVLYWLLANEFQALPEKNIWTSANCQVIENYQNGYYEVRILDNQTISQSSIGLCGWDHLNRNLNSNLNAKSVENTTNATVKCQIPPLPVIIPECTFHTPITNLILLETQADTVQELLQRHLEYYWSAIACVIMAIMCCFWCCYSYWFNWCGCQDRSYWYCGRSNYFQFFDASDNDIEEDFRIAFH